MTFLESISDHDALRNEFNRALLPQGSATSLPLSTELHSAPIVTSPAVPQSAFLLLLSPQPLKLFPYIFTQSSAQRHLRSPTPCFFFFLDR